MNSNHSDALMHENPEDKNDFFEKLRNTELQASEEFSLPPRINLDYQIFSTPFKTPIIKVMPTIDEEDIQMKKSNSTGTESPTTTASERDGDTFEGKVSD